MERKILEVFKSVTNFELSDCFALRLLPCIATTTGQHEGELEGSEFANTKSKHRYDN